MLPMRKRFRNRWFRERKKNGVRPAENGEGMKRWDRP